MSDEVKIPRSVFANELKRQSMERGLARDLDELVSEIPDDLANREKVIEAIREAMNNPVTRREFFAKPGDMVSGDLSVTYQATIGADITQREFFIDPKNIQKFGSEVITSAKKLVTDFVGKKAGIEAKKGS